MFLPHFLPQTYSSICFCQFTPPKMSFPALLHLFAVEPFKLFFAFFGAIFQFLLSLTSRNKPKLRTSSQSRQIKSEIELNGATNIYEEYSIVGEQCLSMNVPPQQYYTNNGGIFNSTRAWIQGRKWEFTVSRNANSQHTLKLALVDLDLQFSSVAAEILFWQWHRGKQICILQKFQKCFQHPGSNIQFQLNGPIGNILPSDGYFNVLIRTLEKRQQSIPLPSFDELENVNILVGTECFAVSKHYLMSISPVFHKMFAVEMREKQQNKVILEEIGPAEFKAFLEAVSPKQIHPNPYNIYELLKLADRFQCDLLRDRCEEHLVNGVEFPLIERLLCAEIYRLEKLKNYILKSLAGSGLRDFYEENQAALNLLSKDLLIQLTSRICTSVKIDRASFCLNCQRNMND